VAISKSKLLAASQYLLIQKSRLYRLSAAEILKVGAFTIPYPKRKKEKKKEKELRLS